MGTQFTAWLACLVCLAVSAQAIQFQHFDDFLLHIRTSDADDDEQTVLTVTMDETAANATAEEEADNELVNDLDVLGYFREVPREHWSCCMLGKLAGDKGFHCHSTFYRTRIQMRNTNRAHNQKMLFHGAHAQPDWGQGIMRTFQRCVDRRHSADFHKCCFAASIERRERHRWFQYRGGNDEL